MRRAAEPHWSLYTGSIVLKSHQNMTQSKIVFALLGGVLLLIWLFGSVFPGQLVFSQSFEIFGLSIRWYGLILAAAVVAAYFLAKKTAAVHEATEAELDSLAIYVLVAGFIGARLYHVVSELSYYLANPIEVVYVWQGGLGIFGAVLGGLLGLWLFWLKHKRSSSFGNLLDWLTPSLVIGQIIGRFGNLVNYEAYGQPTDLPWKMFVPQTFRLPGWQEFNYFHPLFVYEALGSLLILLVLINLPKLTKRIGFIQYSGQTFAWWLILYGILRLLTESLRLDSNLVFGVKQNLLVAGAMLAVGLGAMIYYKINNQHES